MNNIIRRMKGGTWYYCRRRHLQDAAYFWTQNPGPDDHIIKEEHHNENGF